MALVFRPRLTTLRSGAAFPNKREYVMLLDTALEYWQLLKRCEEVLRVWRNVGEADQMRELQMYVDRIRNPEAPK